MLINDDRKFIFFHIPKTGGTTIQKHLVTVCRSKKEKFREFWGLSKNGDLSHIHYDRAIKYIDIGKLDKYIKVCIVRNPYDRLYSGFIEKRGYRYSKNKEGFNKFIKEKLNNKIIYQKEFIHIAPCSYFTHSNKVLKMNKVIKYENYKKEIDAFLMEHGYNNKYSNRNVRNKQFNAQYKYLDKYNEESIAKVNDIFNLDFEYFGYEKK